MHLGLVVLVMIGLLLVGISYFISSVPEDFLDFLIVGFGIIPSNVELLMWLTLSGGIGLLIICAIVAVKIWRQCDS